MHKIYLMRKAIPFKCHGVVFLDTYYFTVPFEGGSLPGAMFSGFGGLRGSGVLGGVEGACCGPPSRLLPSIFPFCMAILCCNCSKVR